MASVPAWEHVQDLAKFDDVILSGALRTVARKWQPSSGSMLLLGPSGVGKTSAIAMALRRYRDGLVETVLREPGNNAACESLRRFGFLWVTASEITRAIQQHRLGSGGESPLVERAVRTPILVIDELGPEPTRYSGELFDIVDRRYSDRSKKPTIATSGLASSGAYVERYGDAMQRRLTQNGIGRLVDLYQSNEPQHG